MIGFYDRIGFRRHEKAFRAGDLQQNLSGRLCLVTGGNAGLGRATAIELAKRGAHVRLLCRDPNRALLARDEIRSETANEYVEADTLNIADLDAVREYVDRSKFERVDVLIHNAGVLPDKRLVTRQGLEVTFATHVAGPHLLTHLLGKSLRASPDARVIFVSSGGMYTQRLSLEDIGWQDRTYDGVHAYAQTKRMQVVSARKWADAFSGSAVSVYSMHPGWADTGGVRSSLPRFHALTRSILRTPAEGADTVVWLAIKQPPPPSGGFWFDRQERGAHYLPWTIESRIEREKLWDLCDKITSSADFGS